MNMQLNARVKARILSRRPTLEAAKRLYVHRFTMEHVPHWSRFPVAGGDFYAPQFRTDQEWYDNTLFPGEPGNPQVPDNVRSRQSEYHCYTTGQTWPLGQWLKRPYAKE